MRTCGVRTVECSGSVVFGCLIAPEYSAYLAPFFGLSSHELDPQEKSLAKYTEDEEDREQRVVGKVGTVARALVMCKES